MNSLYHFCSKPPELGGSLICICHGNKFIHSEKHVTVKEMRRTRADKTGDDRHSIRTCFASVGRNLLDET